MSDIQPWLSDAICRAVTGDGLLRRQLYTDSDVSVLAFRRVVALTSIDPGALNGDLADRLLTIELERIPESSRSAEEAMTQKWAELHAGVLGGLLHTTVNVLRALGPIRHTNLPRMADFARVLLAVDQVLGTNGYGTYAEQASRTAETVADGDSVIVAIREQVTQPWDGTASELLKLLTPDKPPKDWPSTPQGMGGRLARAAPSLRSLGWTVEKLARSDKKGTRGWEITPPTEEYPAGSSASSELTLTDDTGSWPDNQPDHAYPHVFAGQDPTDDADMPAVPPLLGPHLSHQPAPSATSRSTAASTAASARGMQRDEAVAMPPPCLSCGRPTPTGSRCPDCARDTQRAKRARRPYAATSAEKRRRAAAVDQWRATYGDWCPGWEGREPHAVVWPNILSADHTTPVAVGGDERGPLTVRCRRCNSARGARP
ncbi:MAG TPA: hypothetical protein VFH23_18530 [Jiangellaceae bacterium]|nr:hypothetical protein [Jiangellaceae bacterium]